MVGNLREKGKKLYDQYMPQDVKDMFANKANMGGSNESSHGNAYTGTQGNAYTG